MRVNYRNTGPIDSTVSRVNYFIDSGNAKEPNINLFDAVWNPDKMEWTVEVPGSPKFHCHSDVGDFARFLAQYVRVSKRPTKGKKD